MARVIVNVPSALRDLTGGRATVRVEASSLEGILASLRDAEPLLASRLLADDGTVRGYVNLFLDGVDVRRLDAAGWRADSDAELSIVPSVAGG